MLWDWTASVCVFTHCMAIKPCLDPNSAQREGAAEQEWVGEGGGDPLGAVNLFPKSAAFWASARGLFFHGAEEEGEAKQNDGLNSTLPLAEECGRNTLLLPLEEEDRHSKRN